MGGGLGGFLDFKVPTGGRCGALTWELPLPFLPLKTLEKGATAKETRDKNSSIDSLTKSSVCTGWCCLTMLSRKPGKIAS